MRIHGNACREISGYIKDENDQKRCYKYETIGNGKDFSIFVK
jgi:septal ring-binding cell division protein DamX